MMLTTASSYAQFALSHPNEKWELHDGVLREKPPMTIEHNRAGRNLTRQLVRQLDPDQFDVVNDQGRVNREQRSYYIPDVFVVPMELVRRLLAQGRTLEAYAEPLPLVVEIWSPSTGAYDVDQKLMEYQRRGDLEIWRIHPYERTLTRWLRQANGTYAEMTQPATGTVTLSALPGVTIDVDALFA